MMTFIKLRLCYVTDVGYDTCIRMLHFTMHYKNILRESGDFDVVMFQICRSTVCANNCFDSLQKI